MCTYLLNKHNSIERQKNTKKHGTWFFQMVYKLLNTHTHTQIHFKCCFCQIIEEKKHTLTMPWGLMHFARKQMNVYVGYTVSDCIKTDKNVW